MWKMDYLLKVLNDQSSSQHLGIPLALVHGDLWTNNVLFEKDDAGKPTNSLLAIIDWQTAHAGNPMEDVCRLLISSCSAQLRRDNWHSMVQYYHDRCTHHYGAPLPFSVGQLERAYRFVFPHAVAFYVTSMTMIMHSEAICGKFDDPERPRRRNELIDRAKASIADAAECRPVVEEIMAKCAKA